MPKTERQRGKRQRREKGGRKRHGVPLSLQLSCSIGLDYIKPWIQPTGQNDVNFSVVVEFQRQKRGRKTM